LASLALKSVTCASKQTANNMMTCFNQYISGWKTESFCLHMHTHLRYYTALKAEALWLVLLVSMQQLRDSGQFITCTLPRALEACWADQIPGNAWGLQSLSDTTTCYACSMQICCLAGRLEQWSRFSLDDSICGTCKGVSKHLNKNSNGVTCLAAAFRISFCLEDKVPSPFNSRSMCAWALPRSSSSAELYVCKPSSMIYSLTLDGIHPIYNIELGLGTITIAYEWLTCNWVRSSCKRRLCCCSPS